MGVTGATHERAWPPPGQTWCPRITFAGQRVTQQSTLSFAEDYRVAAGAAVVTHKRANACARLQENSSKHSFEPLAGLDDGTIGWRTGSLVLLLPDS